MHNSTIYELSSCFKEITVRLHYKGPRSVMFEEVNNQLNMILHS